ncbi:RraA family protein [Nocardia arthritidis]|uniref:Putative 4-hydroxy-4-methyl-2-oxoglutarate aldolase n=1 Tax=Nocardia arthritidis TaxID=228602 RepID=A0A6G9YQB6_9NOCA|nr:RraA family protein [Nocardia arthritidis]QIS15113.1 RraA family protein [Nocardia arthritidis]
MLDNRLLARFESVDTTSICDADKSIRVLDSGIRGRSANRRILGPAFTIRCRGDFFGVLRAVEAAAPGDVLVVDGGGIEIAYAGELFARGALARGLGGIIVDGGYRDIAYVRGCELPVYSRFVTPMAGTTSDLGELQISITCGGVPVAPGELIMADDEGVIVVDPKRVESLLDSAAATKEAEAKLIARLAAGATLSEGLNVAAHTEALLGGKASALRFV